MKSETNRILLTFAILTVLISFIWFKFGYHLAGGEEGLSLYSPTRSLSRYIDPWYKLGGGYLTAAYLPRTTLMAVGSFFEIFLPTWIFQRVMFMTLIVGGMSGMYIFNKYLNINRYGAFFASIFYFGNLYSMSQVWMRFLYTGMFAWAIIPWLLIFSIKYITSGKKILLIGAITLTIAGSNVYGIPSYIFTTWTPVCIYLLFAIYHSQNKGKIISRALILFSTWFLVHGWWIYPMLNLSDTSNVGLSELVRRNFASLQGSSSYFPNSEIITLTQKYLFGKESPFYDFYKLTIVKVFEIVVLFVSIIGSLKLLNRKYSWIFSILIIGWFISKGSNSPLGGPFFENLFKFFPPSMSLRNSYEKFGLVFVFAYSILFGVGLSWLYKNHRLVAVCVSIIFFILTWPVWTGRLYLPKVNVIVPDDYKLANHIINTQNQRDVAILHTPSILGEGVSYTWGYSGAEASEYLFDKRSWSRQSGPESFDKLYSEISQKVKSNQLVEQDLISNNISFIVVHYDYSDNFNAMYGQPGEINKYLSSRDWLDRIYSGRSIEVYELKNTTSELIKVSSGIKVTKLSQRRWKIINVDKVDTQIQLRNTDNECWKLRDNNKHLLEKKYTSIYPSWKLSSKENVLFLECNIFPWEL